MPPPEMPPRPPTRKASSGSTRPPTASRFQEGSMNDRASAAPPAQFLGPEELRQYEEQFYTESLQQHPDQQSHATTSAGATGSSSAQQPSMQPQRPRYNRPFSAQAISMPPLPAQQQQQRSASSLDEHNSLNSRVAHKKTSGFFGRVRDALFSRNAGATGVQSQSQPQPQGREQQLERQQQLYEKTQQHQEDVQRKHNSLQEPLRSPPHLGQSGRSNSEIHIPLMMPPTVRNASGGVDRPSREDMLASYNELMATGFFQSHAIQSTRHAPPGGMRVPGAAAPGSGLASATASASSSTALPPSIIPPRRVSSAQQLPRPHVQAQHQGSQTPISPPALPVGSDVPRSSTSSARPSLRPRNRSSREFARDALSKVVSIPELRGKDSWAALRGRKRARADVEDNTPSGANTPTSPLAVEVQQDEDVQDQEHQQQQYGNVGGGGVSYFSQPLKRVAKKLRKMPSSTSASVSASVPPSATLPAMATDGGAMTSTTAFAAPGLSSQLQRSRESTAPPIGPPGDGIVRLVPSFSSGGTLHHNDRAVRLRSPSPGHAPVAVTDSRQRDPSRATKNGGSANVIIHGKKSASNTGSSRSGNSNGSDAASSGTGQQEQQQRPRRTFSGSLTGSLRGRSNRRLLAKRASATQMHDGSDADPVQANANALGAWQHASLEDPSSFVRSPSPHKSSSHDAGAAVVINNNSSGGGDHHRQQRQQQRERRAQGQTDRDTHRRPVPKTQPPKPQVQQQQQQQRTLQVVPDANRGIPSVPLIPQRWHGEGKAYHLRDRGQRQQVVVNNTATAGTAESAQGQGLRRSTGQQRRGARGGNNAKSNNLVGKENNGSSSSWFDDGVENNENGDVAMGGMETEESRWRIGSAV